MKAFGPILVLSLLISCVSAPVEEIKMDPDAFVGEGLNSSPMEALRQAKVSVIREGVKEILSPELEDFYSTQLSQDIYSISDPDIYLASERLVVVVREKRNSQYYYRIQSPVNRQALESVLFANGYLGGRKDPSQDIEEPQQESSRAQDLLSPSDSSRLSDNQQVAIDRYIDNMTYMVYFSEEAGTDPLLMKGAVAVAVANDYLLSRAYRVIDLQQVEDLKNDQRMIYEEETGQEVGFVQWIAQKLNADIYIEIDGVTDSQDRGSSYYGTATGTLKIYEASTAQLLGSQAFSSPRVFSRDSAEDAMNSALKSSVYKVMPEAIEQARTLMARSAATGIQYELVIQGAGDSRLMSQFRRALSRKVEEIRALSASEGENKYNVYYIGSASELEDLVYEVSENIPGLEYLYLVFLRGKMLTFNTGY